MAFSFLVVDGKNAQEPLGSRALDQSLLERGG
jgi:hypothetical protein